MPVHLISEPEAAAIYTLPGQGSDTLSVDDTIVVMDAGGGTVDLVSYTITNLAPTLEVEEAAPSSGGKCGSTFLIKRFATLIDRKLARASGFNKDIAAEVLEDFEKTTKRRFMAKADAREVYTVRVSGLNNNERLGISRGRLNITGAELHEVFRPVIVDCLELLEGQITASGKHINAVLLVGSFGASVYLQHRIRERLRLLHSSVSFITPANAWQAVVQGADMSGAVAISSRRARRHYGMELLTSLKDSHSNELKALAT